MRTTVDLPAAVHRRIRELALERHQSFSAVVTNLTLRGLAALGESLEIATDPRSGFPVITLGRQITAAEVVNALDDE